jgi:hypothetical protein
MEGEFTRRMGVCENSRGIGLWLTLERTRFPRIYCWRLIEKQPVFAGLNKV